MAGPGSSYEASVHAYITRKVGPEISPLWKEPSPQSLTRLCRPAMFFSDKRRGWLLHSRLKRNQAYPINAGGPDYTGLPFTPPLEPSRCSGKWFLVSTPVFQDLRAVEADMFSLWESIERGRELSKRQEAAALYLRQLFDHFLWTLAKSAKNDVATAAGSFGNPFKLDSIQEPHMLNAIRNKSLGKPYSKGAWVFVESEGDVKPRTTKRRKQRQRDRQPAEIIAGGSRKSGSEGDSSEDDSEHQRRTRSFKKIKLEEDAAPSSSKLQQISSSDITQEMDTDDPTVSAACDQSANPEGQPPDDNGIDTDSTLSNVPSSSGGEEEEPSQDSTTPGRPDATTRVSEQPSRSKKVQFVTMFDEAVPILQAILDGMPISPQDLEGHPNYDEKQAALMQWGQRKTQAVRLLGAMQKAYLSVMVPAEPEVEEEVQAAQETSSTQNEADRERTLANDPLPSQAPPANDMSDAAPSVEKKLPEEPRSLTTRSSSRHQADGGGTSATVSQVSRAKGKAAAMKPRPPGASSYRSRDDGFWTAFGY